MERKRDLLLVIDMQNVYLPGQEWACPSMRVAITNICRLLDTETAEDTAFTQFVPPVHPVGTWEQYNIENASVNADIWLNTIVDELQPYTEKYPVYDKSVYSSMKIEPLAELARQFDRIVITGVVAECCVLSTMMEVIDLGCQVLYLTDCISGQSEQNEAAIRKIAESFAPLHTQVMSSAEYVAQKRSESKAGELD